MFCKQLLLVCFLCVSQALASSDDRFIKKYAMMKIYESCFGPEVVKEIRQEMKEAYAKCSAPSVDSSAHHIPSVLLSKLPPGFALDPTTQTITKPTDGVVQNQENDLSNIQEQPQKSPHGGVLTFRPQGPTAYPQQQPSIPPYMMPTNPQFRPFSSATPFYQFPYGAPGMFYPPGVQYNPYAYQQQYQQGYYQQPYFGSHRMGRDMDLRDRLDMISRAPGAPGAHGRVRNITCVMQELGYVDHNLEPNYEQITQRISNLPVSSELKGDIQDGLQFCQKFSSYLQQCVPDLKRDVAPLSQELIKPMFFFRCYKHKKLEACIMKDIRERFTSEDELDTDTDFRFRSARSIRDDPMSDPRFEALDEMAVYLYDYLSGGNGFDFDLYM